MSSGFSSSSVWSCRIASSRRSRSARFRPSCSWDSRFSGEVVGNAAVESDRLLGVLLLLGDGGELDQNDIAVVSQRQRILQIEPDEGFAAAAVQSSRENQKKLAGAIGRGCDHAGDVLALHDLFAQIDQRQTPRRKFVRLVENCKCGVLLSRTGKKACIGLRSAQPGVGCGASRGDIADRRLVGCVSLVGEAAQPRRSGPCCRRRKDHTNPVLPSR